MAAAASGGAPAGPSKLTPKILLEGTRLTFKTEIAFALNEHPRIVGPRKYRYHSPIVSAEWCGFTPFPWGRGLVNFAPEEEERAMETYRTWLRLFQLLPHYSWIIDRFHLSTRAWQLRHRGQDLDFGWLEEGLHRLGFHLVLCWRPAGTFAEARRRRLRESAKPDQYDALGDFVEEQELMLRMARGSRLPRLELDVSPLDPAAAADRIAAWLEEVGGLHLPGPAFTG